MSQDTTCLRLESLAYKKRHVPVLFLRVPPTHQADRPARIFCARLSLITVHQIKGAFEAQYSDPETGDI